MVVSGVGESAAGSPLAVAAADCTLWADGAAMSERGGSTAVGSAGLPLLIGATLAAGTVAAAGVDVGVGSAVEAGEAGDVGGTGAAVEAELVVSAGGGLDVDDVLAVCSAALEDVSDVVACGAGLLTVAAAVAGELVSVVVDAWSAGADAAAPDAGVGA